MFFFFIYKQEKKCEKEELEMADNGKSYQIFRYEKVKSAGAIRWREIEQNRTQADKNIDFVGDIDFERTQNNVYLVRGKDFLKRIEEELKNHGIEKHRKDAILMLDGVVTMSPEKAKEMTQEEIEQYFRDALKFVEKYQGVVINAVIHYDETTPHLHYDVIPLIQKADNTWKLSAKDIVGNSSKMTKMQTLFNEEVGQKYGLERGERKAPNKENRKHKTKLQHDIEMQQATIIEQENIIKDCEMLEQAYTATIQNQEATMQDNDVAIQNQVDINKQLQDGYVRMANKFNRLKEKFHAVQDKCKTANKIIHNANQINAVFEAIKTAQKQMKHDIEMAEDLIAKGQIPTAKIYMRDVKEAEKRIDESISTLANKVPLEEIEWEYGDD